MWCMCFVCFLLVLLSFIKWNELWVQSGMKLRLTMVSGRGDAQDIYCIWI